MTLAEFIARYAIVSTREGDSRVLRSYLLEGEFSVNHPRKIRDARILCGYSATTELQSYLGEVALKALVNCSDYSEYRDEHSRREQRSDRDRDYHYNDY